MEENKFPKTFQEKVDEYCAEFDRMIELGKKYVETENERRRNLKLDKNYVKTYENYPMGTEGDYKRFREYGIENLQELIDHKEEIAISRAYAYIRSGYYLDELNAAGKAESDALSEKFGLPFGIAIALGIVGLFFKWWIGLILFLVSYAIGATVIMEKNKPKFDELSAITKEKKEALAQAKEAIAYANETLSSLSNKEKERVNLMDVDLRLKYYETQKVRREIEQLKSQIDALSRPSYSSSTKTSSSGNQTTSSASGRNEIVDDAGRSKGYTEDGRIYDQKSNLVGYVDEHNRVYDADYKRVGEVRSDGKIEKYR